MSNRPPSPTSEVTSDLPTLVDSHESSGPGAVALDTSVPLDDRGFADRYGAYAIIGEGGMGEVRALEDRRIGREVAMKVIRPGVGSRSDVRVRFEREARVQGQLEHPSIVPVYDLGIGPDGDAYFTMKRVRGHGLELVIHRLREADAQFVERFPTRKLLTAFRQACLALAFAHSRGVIHRDLKPANIMLGDFGEVYVLDWGLAKVTGTEDVAIDHLAPATRALAGETVRGAVVGTPGYMPPEQIRSAADVLDERADIYALGAILFEILTLQPLHERMNPPEKMLLKTLAGANARASTRVPERNVAPELESICVKATRFDCDDRHRSVREMVDEIERFLDGDRDTARRRELAAEHSRAAATAAMVARAGGRDAGSARAEAIREVNRALALDPRHEEATQTMLQLLLAPPSEVPQEAERELESSMRRERRTTARIATWAYLSWFFVAPMMLWQGIRSWPLFIAIMVAVVTSISAAWYAARRGDGATMSVVMASSSIAIALSTMHLGPFLLIPGLAAANTLVFAMSCPRGLQRVATIIAGALAVVVPMLLELASGVSPSIAFRGGRIAILPRMVEFPMLPTMLFLVLTSVSLVIIPSLAVSRLRDEAVAANRRVMVHLWHLRQFLPDRAQGVARVSHPPQRYETR